MDSLIFYCEVIGTIAFSISGAFVGLRNKSDIFGVIVLGTVTATGGGMIRDVILGRIPPASFVNPSYITIAVITALVVFIIAYRRERQGKLITKDLYKTILFYMDSIGLGIFAVVGVNGAWRLYGADNALLLAFCGMITGVGGGMLRDVLVCHQPDILTKDVYAVATLIGSYLSIFLFRMNQPIAAIWLPTVAVVLIRMVVYRYSLNLPKVHDFREH